MFSERICEVVIIRVLDISVCPVFALGVDSPLSSGRQALVLGRTSQRLAEESEKLC